MKRSLSGGLVTILLVAGNAALAAEYVIDEAHSFVRFRIQHLGISWTLGSFNDIEGGLSYDSADPAASRIDLSIATASVDTNHAERDKRLRGDDFLDVKRYPVATFKSTRFTPSPTGGKLEGELTLHGVTRTVVIDVEKTGEGPDPWGGYRVGFLGTTSINRRDFGIDYNLGPRGDSVDFEFTIEGKRK